MQDSPISGKPGKLNLYKLLAAKSAPRITKRGAGPSVPSATEAPVKVDAATPKGSRGSLHSSQTSSTPADRSRKSAEAASPNAASSQQVAKKVRVKKGSLKHQRLKEVQRASYQRNREKILAKRKAKKAAKEAAQAADPAGADTGAAAEPEAVVQTPVTKAGQPRKEQEPGAGPSHSQAVESAEETVSEAPGLDLLLQAAQDLPTPDPKAADAANKTQRRQNKPPMPQPEQPAAKAGEGSQHPMSGAARAQAAGREAAAAGSASAGNGGQAMDADSSLQPHDINMDGDDPAGESEAEVVLVPQHQEAPDYSDQSQWVLGWNGIFYPKRRLCHKDDKRVGTEVDEDSDQEFAIECILDEFKSGGETWALVKWWGWECDIGASKQDVIKMTDGKGHWEPISSWNSGAKAMYKRWRKKKPDWYRRQVEVMGNRYVLQPTSSKSQHAGTKRAADESGAGPSSKVPRTASDDGVTQDMDAGGPVVTDDLSDAPGLDLLLKAAQEAVPAPQRPSLQHSSPIPAARNAAVVQPSQPATAAAPGPVQPAEPQAEVASQPEVLTTYERNLMLHQQAKKRGRTAATQAAAGTTGPPGAAQPAQPTVAASRPSHVGSQSAPHNAASPRATPGVTVLPIPLYPPARSPAVVQGPQNAAPIRLPTIVASPQAAVPSVVHRVSASPSSRVPAINPVIARELDLAWEHNLHRHTAASPPAQQPKQRSRPRNAYSPPGNNAGSGTPQQGLVQPATGSLIPSPAFVPARPGQQRNPPGPGAIAAGVATAGRAASANAQPPAAAPEPVSARQTAHKKSQATSSVQVSTDGGPKNKAGRLTVDRQAAGGSTAAQEESRSPVTRNRARMGEAGSGADVQVTSKAANAPLPPPAVPNSTPGRVTRRGSDAGAGVNGKQPAEGGELRWQLRQPRTSTPGAEAGMGGGAVAPSNTPVLRRRSSGSGHEGLTSPNSPQEATSDTDTQQPARKLRRTPSHTNPPSGSAGGGPDYSDRLTWEKSWNNIYYPRTELYTPGDRPVAAQWDTEEQEEEEYEVEAILDEFKYGGETYALVKWWGWECDVGLSKEDVVELTSGKGHWEPISEWGTGAKAMYRKWKKSPPEWYKKQRSTTAAGARKP